MSLRIYSTLSKQKEIFQPVKPGKVGIYLCGPTVYKPPHIGHMVGPVIFDAIKRYLQFKGFEVTWVVNITDVDDKLIDAAAKVKTSVTDLAEKYTKEYLDVLSLLGVDSIDKFPKASEHMNEIIELCNTLITKGHAYAAEGNVWFDVTKDEDYGKLSNRKVEEQEAGLRTLEGSGKKNPADFALWKSAKPGEPAWDSPWGSGRPGWHIECSAMSMKYLGSTLDIHGGGMDLMFPHHENELAQSECATGQTFAKYWLHNGLTRIKTKLASGEWADEKMSGSIGNVVSARDLVERYGADLLRYLLLSTHYRRPIEFTPEAISSSKKGLATFLRLIDRVQRLSNQTLTEKTPDMDQTAATLLEKPEHAPFARAVLGYKMKWLEMMDDDFNTAGAIAVMHELAGEINSFVEKNQVEQKKQPELIGAATAAVATLRNFGLVLGLFRSSSAAAILKESTLDDDLMKLLIKLRADARISKNFALADAIRQSLTEIGVTLEDRADGTIWRKE